MYFSPLKHYKSWNPAYQTLHGHSIHVARFYTSSGRQVRFGEYWYILQYNNDTIYATNYVWLIWANQSSGYDSCDDKCPTHRTGLSHPLLLAFCIRECEGEEEPSPIWKLSCDWSVDTKTNMADATRVTKHLKTNAI